MKNLRVKVVALLALGLLGLAAGLAVAEGQKGGGGTAAHTQTVGGGTTVKTEEPAKPSTGPRPAPIVFRPHYLSPSTAVPLLIALHPSGDTPADWRQETKFNTLARQYGFVVAYLGSLPAPGHRPGAGPAWRKVDEQRNMAYIGSEITSLIKAENIDPKRVYVMGFSAGGTMTFEVACTFSSRIAGIAVVSGAMITTFPCHLTHPMSEIEIIGTKDLIPYQGRGNGLSVFQVAARFRALNGCAHAAAHQATVGAAQTTTWGPCKNNTGVSLNLIVGGRHHYPGEHYPTPLPADTNFPASQVIWNFFATHPGS